MFNTAIREDDSELFFLFVKVIAVEPMGKNLQSCLDAKVYNIHIMIAYA